MLLRVIAFLVLTSPAFGSDVPRLPVDADICAIHFAMTGNVRNGCPSARNDGITRNVAHAAASLGSVAGNGYYIHFEFASGELTIEYQEHLKRLSTVLNGPDTSALCLKLVGHTDAVGSRAFNMNLSAARARTVRLFLVGALGVAENRILEAWKGEDQLLAGLAPTDARNRRVEILARKTESEGCGS